MSDFSVLDGNANKTPLSQSLHRLGAAKSQDAVQALPKGMPCRVTAIVSPGIVTVEVAADTTPWTLEPITVPVLAPPYVTYPIQVGDRGRLIGSDVREGQLTGLGAGTPRLTDTVANLAAAAFIWLGNTAQTTPDPDAVVTMGNLIVSADKLGFFANPKAAKQSLTGALSSVSDPAAKAVLQSIVDALCDDGYGLTKDSTS